MLGEWKKFSGGGSNIALFNHRGIMRSQGPLDDLFSSPDLIASIDAKQVDLARKKGLPGGWRCWDRANNNYFFTYKGHIVMGIKKARNIARLLTPSPH